VLTRPLGASIADGLAKPRSLHGLGLGSGPVALAFALLIAVLVSYLSVTKADVQREPRTVVRLPSRSQTAVDVRPDAS